MLSNINLPITGILPAKYPDELVYENQPESVTMGIRNFEGKLGWGRRRVYLPEKYLQVLDTVVPPDTRAQGPKLLLGHMPPVRHITAEVAEGRPGSEFAEVPVNWPEALPAISNLQKQGYLLAGVMPDIFMTEKGEPYDTVVLYKPPAGVTMHFDDVIYVVPSLEPLHNFMKTEYHERYVAGNRT